MLSLTAAAFPLRVNTPRNFKNMFHSKVIYHSKKPLSVPVVSVRKLHSLALCLITRRNNIHLEKKCYFATFESKATANRSNILNYAGACF